MDRLRLPNGVLGGLNTSLLVGSVKGKSEGTGFPDLDRITKLEKSPRNKNWFNKCSCGRCCYCAIVAPCRELQFVFLEFLELSYEK